MLRYRIYKINERAPFKKLAHYYLKSLKSKLEIYSLEKSVLRHSSPKTPIYSLGRADENRG